MNGPTDQFAGELRPRLILLTQWFDPEPTVKGLLFARALKDRGYDVEVVTGFPNYPGGKVYAGYKIKPIQREMVDGVAVTRLALYPSHNNRPLQRVTNYVSFCISVFFYLTFIARRADVLYVYHPPLTVGLAAAMAKLFRRTPTVLDVQDMWPDTLSATGMLDKTLPLRIVGAVCLWVYARMTHIVALSPGFRRLLISRGVPPEKVTMIYNWADETAIMSAGETRPTLMPDNGQFRLLFAGNMGLAQNLDVVLDAARIVCSVNGKVDFCFLGGGLEAENVRQRVSDERLSCVHFFPKVSMAEVGSFLMAADCLLVNLRPDPLFEITIPSKTQAYMSAGRPIIIAVTGDAAVLVTDAKAGIVVPPGDSVALAAAVQEMFGLSTEARAAMATSARRYYDDHLSLQCGVDAFERLFRAIQHEEGASKSYGKTIS
jgi:colanic acid biosynthesis glycosyl transferase WcaI